MGLNVLLINVHSYLNAGDAALTEVAIEQLQDNFPGCSITLVLNDPASYTQEKKSIKSLFNWLKSDDIQDQLQWNKRNLLVLLPASLIPIVTDRIFHRPVFVFTPNSIRPLIQAYLECDIVVSVAGGFLYSSGKGLVFLVSVFSLFLAILAGKPLYMLPQSIGPFRSRWERILLRWLLGQTRVVMAREIYSMAELKTCGLEHPRCYLVPDLAFSFTGSSQSTIDSRLKSEGISLSQHQPLLGVTMINWGLQNPRFNRQSQYEAAIMGTVQFFIEHYHGSVLFFPQVCGPAQSQDDRIPARRVVEMLGQCNDKLTLLDKYLPLDLVWFLCGKVDVLIGTRMHSNIFALSQGVPAIAIGYQHKTKGIASTAGMEKWTIDIERVDRNLLIRMLSTLWDERYAIRYMLAQKMPEITKKVSLAGRLIVSDYERYLNEQKNRKNPHC